MWYCRIWHVILIERLAWKNVTPSYWGAYWVKMIRKKKKYEVANLIFMRFSFQKLNISRWGQTRLQPPGSPPRIDGWAMLVLLLLHHNDEWRIPARLAPPSSWPLGSVHCLFPSPSHLPPSFLQSRYLREAGRPPNDQCHGNRAIS